MKQFLLSPLVLTFVAVAGLARAAENPTGTWKWEVKVNDQSIDIALKLKLDDDKLTGSINSPLGETAIQDGKYKDGDLSFTVLRERDGQKMSFQYTGKLSGDTIKGKTEIERNGETSSRDWEAKRAKE
jgi:hypothetical protein